MDRLIIDGELLALLTSHQRRLAGYLRMLVANRADAEELLQETNLWICRHADQFQPGTDFAAWGLPMAHVCVLQWRQRQSRDRLVFDDELLESLAIAAQSFDSQADLRIQALEACLKKLVPQDQQLITQLYGDPDVAPQELAARVGRSAKGIYESLDRIRQRLLDCIRRTLSAEEYA